MLQRLTRIYPCAELMRGGGTLPTWCSSSARGAPSGSLSLCISLPPSVIAHRRISSVSASSSGRGGMPRQGGPGWRLARAFTSRPAMFILSATAVSAGAWMMQQRQQTSVTSQEMRATSGQAAPQASSESSPLRLLLASAAAMIPHPAKVARGGEDAYFLAADGRCVGVADGVGGWAEVGVDPGLYSRELMRHAQEAAAASRVRGAREPLAIMETAHKLTKARGSCTACILCVEGDTLHGANLGDSGFMIVRDGALAFMSPQQQHEFNFPFQLGSADAMSDVPSEAEFFSIPVQPNDVVVAATDGVLDNVYPDEAAALVAASKARGEEPRRAAQALAEFARTRAADPGHLSPFAYAAQQMGYRYFGGKMDDITVVVAYVVPEESKSVEGEDKLLSKL